MRDDDTRSSTTDPDFFLGSAHSCHFSLPRVLLVPEIFDFVLQLAIPVGIVAFDFQSLLFLLLDLLL